MMTPEGRVKVKVKKQLSAAGVFMYWPVPSGRGASMVDCLAWWGETGKINECWAIECKREGITKPTPRQATIMKDLRKHGVRTFLATLGDDGGLLWLEQKD